MQCNATRRDATRCDATQRNEMQCNAIQCSAVQCNEMQYNNKIHVCIYADSRQRIYILQEGTLAVKCVTQNYFYFTRRISENTHRAL